MPSTEEKVAALENIHNNSKTVEQLEEATVYSASMLHLMYDPVTGEPKKMLSSKLPLGAPVPFPTLADLQGNAGNQSITYVVLSDPTPTNNGFYYWDGTSYVKGHDLVDKQTVLENIALPERILADTVVTNTGVVTTTAGWKTFKLPVSEGDIITLGNYTIDSGGHSAYYLGNTLVSYEGIIDNDDLPHTVTIPPGVDLYYISIKRPSDGDEESENFQANYGSTLLPYSEPVEYLKKLDNKPILADKLSNENTTPTPTEGKNAVNLDYFNENALKNSDLTIDLSLNLAKQEFILNDTAVNSPTGQVAANTGFKTMKITGLISGQKISFGNFTIDSGSNASWYLGDTLVSFQGNYSPTEMLSGVENITVPAGVDTFYFICARPTNTDEDHAEIMFNIGDNLLPYVSPQDIATHIKGNKIGGGDIPDNVAIEGTSVSFASIATQGLQLDLPEGATEPAGLNIGDAWIDTNDDTIKVKRS